MTDTGEDIQHHIGYAYHKLNDRRLMWMEYLEGKIEACRQRLQESGKHVTTQAQREEPEAPVVEDYEDKTEEAPNGHEEGTEAGGEEFPDEWRKETGTAGEEEPGPSADGREQGTETTGEEELW
jgi:hypothetical protein